jgi:hypothetical protein
MKENYYIESFREIYKNIIFPYVIDVSIEKIIPFNILI